MTPEQSGAAGRHPDLVGLLRGETSNAEATEIGRHLHECASCRDDLVDTAVGHVLLSRAAGTLGPDEHLRGGTVAPVEPLVALGPVSELEARWPDPPPRRVPRGSRLMAAAALVVAAGLGVGAGTWLSSRGTDEPTPQRSATLQAVTGNGHGTVSMTEDDGQTTMAISTSDLPAARDGQFYYAWLLDPRTNKMLPLGQVGPSGTASFEVSDNLLAAYSAVDVSLENDDGDPQHSPTSVLRARYA